jgi:hypothetical protein
MRARFASRLRTTFSIDAQAVEPAVRRDRLVLLLLLFIVARAALTQRRR